MDEPKSGCPKCKGTQYIDRTVDGEVLSAECQCLIRKKLLLFLGPELARAKHRPSELFMPTLDPDTGQIIGDRTLDDLFIKGTWAEAAQHLRWAVAGKKYSCPLFRFLMVNDEKLLRVYVGDFAYSKRSKEVRDEIETYNNLDDLISDCSLLIVRLGKLAWKNQAAADVLLEALLMRASDSKPTWLVEGELPFGDGHRFFNDNVHRHIRENFDIVDVGGDVKAARENWAALVEVSGGDATMAEEHEPLVMPETKERFLAEPGALEDRGKSYRRNKRGWRRSGNNSGGEGLPGL